MMNDETICDQNMVEHNTKSCGQNAESHNASEVQSVYKDKKYLWWIIGSAVLAALTFLINIISVFRSSIVVFSQWVVLIATMVVLHLIKHKNAKFKIKVWQLVAIFLTVVVTLLLFWGMKPYHIEIPNTFLEPEWGKVWMAIAYTCLTLGLKAACLTLLLPSIVMVSKSFKKDLFCFCLGVGLVVSAVVLLFLGDDEFYPFVLEIAWIVGALSYFLLHQPKSKKRGAVRWQSFLLGLSMASVPAVLLMSTAYVFCL